MDMFTSNGQNKITDFFYDFKPGHVPLSYVIVTKITKLKLCKLSNSDLTNTTQLKLCDCNIDHI